MNTPQPIDRTQDRPASGTQIEPGCALLRKGLDGTSCESVPGGDLEPEEEPDKGETSLLAKRESTLPVMASVRSAPQRAGGAALSTSDRAFLEPRLGHDFRDVRVHTDPGGVDMARSIGAAAFTVGHHIYFDQGMYSPRTNARARSCSRHELTHVVQQGAAQQWMVAPNAVRQQVPSGLVLQRYTLNGFPPAEEAAMKPPSPPPPARLTRARTCPGGVGA